MANRDEFENFVVTNNDGDVRTGGDYYKHTYDNDKKSFVKEDSSQIVSETVKVEETQRVERHSSLPHTKIRKPELNFSVSNAVAAIGSTAAAVVVSAIVVAVIIVAAFSLSVSMVSATSNTLSFFVEVEQGEGRTFTATLSRGEELFSQQIFASDYITFDDLIPDSEYNLRIVDNESGQEYFNSDFCTLKQDEERLWIENLKFAEDGRLTFVLKANLSGDEFYTINVRDEQENLLVNFDDAVQTKEISLDIGGSSQATIIVNLNGKGVIFIKVDREQPIPPTPDEPIEPTEPATYGEPTFEWSEDVTGGYTAKAVFENVNDAEDKQIFDAVVTSESAPATCETAAKIIYTATVTFEDEEFVDTKEVETGEALGHDYDEPEWEWTETESGYTAVAIFTCANDNSHIERVNATVTTSTVAAECEQAGQTIYTAQVNFEGQAYQERKVVTLQAIGHDYEASFEWTESLNGGYSGATLTLTCQNNPEHVVELEATVTEHLEEDEMGTSVRTVYTATAEYDGETYTDTKTVE